MIWRELAVACVALVFLSLPLWPAVIEALWPSDEEPLPISRLQLQDPRGASKQVTWRYCLSFELDHPLRLAEWLPQQPAGELKPGMFHLPGGGVVPAAFAGTDLLASGPLSLGQSARSGARLYAQGALRLEERSEVLEAHSGAELDLGPSSRVRWWGTGARIRLGRDSSASGALRAEQEIVLLAGSKFYSLRAPLIRADGAYAEAPPVPAALDAGTRQVFESDHRIPDQAVVHGDVIVRGELRVGRGARVFGSIKAHGSVDLGEDAWVSGAVVAQSGVRMGPRSRIEGCVLGEAWVALGAGSKVGREGAPATVSCESLTIQPGARVHGLVRAWKGGQVV